MKLHGQAILDEGWSGVEVAADGTYRWIIKPMLLGNHRLLAVPHGEGVGEDFCWCFYSYPLALASVAVFEPQTQDEPLFWHKRPTGSYIRRAPDRDKDPGYNAPRCVHGSYMNTPCLADPHHCRRKETP